MRRIFPDPADLDGAMDVEAAYYVPPGAHVRANFVAALDGAIELGGRSQPLGGPADRAAFLAMRAMADVILVGAGTVRQEKYGPVRPEPDVIERRRARGQADVPRLAIVSNRGLLDAGAKVFSGAEPPLLLTTAEAVEAHAELEGRAEIITCGDQWVELSVAIGELLERGLERVLCEGGPTLLRSLIQADLLDELCLTMAPRLAGWGHHTLLGDQPLSETVKLELAAVIEADGFLLSRYEAVHP